MAGHRRLAILLAFSLLASAAFAQRERPIYDRVFFEPCEDVVTPHIAWAKPYYQGAPRALFITHRNALREVIELAQRLSLDYTVFAAEKPNQFGETGVGVDAGWRLIQGNSAEELADRLRGALAAPYDVIVIGNLKWDEIPLDCRYLILQKVKSGTGLVGYMPQGRDKYIARILARSEFKWSWALWSGAAQGVEDYFGIGDFTGSVDRTVAHSGEASVRIAGTQVVRGSKEAPRGGYHPGAIDLEPNTEYVFSIWSRTEGLQDGGASVSLHPQPKGVSIPAGSEWTRTEARFTTDDKNLKTGVYLLNYNVGTVWYDDVELKKVGDDTNLLPNPSFEDPGPVPGTLATGVPFRSLPAFQAGADTDSFLRANLQIARFGEGRVGFFAYGGVPVHQMMTPGPKGRVQDCRLDYDYYLALAIKLLLWGANKDSEFVLASAAGPLVEVPAAAGGGPPVAFTLRSPRAVQDARAEFIVRDRRNNLWHRAEQAAPVKQGDNDLSFDLPALPRGSYFADLWIRSGGNVLTFASVGVDASSPTGLAELSLARDSFALGEPLVGQVVLESPPAGAILRLSARDLHGRLLARNDFPASGERVEFSLPLPPSLTIVGWLEARLLRGDQVLDVRTVDYSLNDLYPDRRDVQFVMWMDYPNDFVGPAMAEEFTRNGVDAQYGGAPGYSPFANQWWLPYATRYVDTKTDWYQPKPTREQGDLVRSPCITDPAFREEAAKTLTAKATVGLRCSTLDFTLGDENHFVAGNWDLCFSDTCVADFRRWAQEQYGTLDKLNASWGSDYKTWDEVRPATLEECKKTANFVPWVDHRLHMESVWAGLHSFSRDVIREIVPKARVGYEGSDTHVGSFHAADYWKLAHAMDLNNIYYRDFLSLALHDFAPPDMLMGGGWFGGYAGNRNEPFMRWFPWRTFFKGANSFWVWCGYGSAGSVMAFDVSLYPFFQAACQEIHEIKSGPGKLLVTAQRRHDGIALLYSASSVHVGTYTAGLPAMNETLDALVRLLHDCGLECRVVSYAELAEGKVTNEEFKALLLPCAQALSPAEVAAIKRFASGGGQVIADLRPGITDDHGKPYDTPALDDLFGVAQGPEFQTGDTPGDELGLGSLVCDTALTVRAGKPRAEAGPAPVVVVNDVAKGRAVLLNFSLNGCLSPPAAAGEQFAGWQAGEPYRRFLLALLAEAGVVPSVTVEPDAPRVEVSRFRAGDAEYLGIVQGLPYAPELYTNKKVPAPSARPVTVSLPRKAHVYDVRAGKYLGETNRIATAMTPGIASLYALLPARVDEVRAQAPARARQGDPVEYTLAVRGAKPGSHHVLRLEVLGPDGNERPYYARNLLAEGGRARGELTFALDDAPGKWRLVARDVATGVAGAAEVELTAR